MRTTRMFSLLRPIILKRNTGKQKLINKKILRLRLVKIRFKTQNTKMYQITLKIAVV